jgi:hypothetical protein
MSEAKNPRLHVEMPAALAAVVGPTTKILAIGSVTAKGTPEAIAPVLPFEVRATVRNHLAGRIEQWFFQTEGIWRRLHHERDQQSRGPGNSGKAPSGNSRHDGIRTDRARAARAARHAYRGTAAGSQRRIAMTSHLVVFDRSGAPVGWHP